MPVLPTTNSVILGGAFVVPVAKFQKSKNVGDKPVKPLGSPLPNWTV